MTDPGTTTDTESEGGSGRLGGNYLKLVTASGISNLGDGIGTIAYPWLASAVTRSPLLISVVLVAQRLPWLLFSLPAGVVSDRFDRGRVMVVSNLARAAFTLVVAAIVLGRQSDLPSPDEVDSLTAAGDTGTDVTLYLVVLVATVALGIGEVLYDNANQSFLPHIVDSPNLEKANGRLWSVEMIANSFVGPPLGAFLLVGVFSLPFFVDAATFAVSAGLIAAITVRRPTRASAPAAPAAGRADRSSMVADIKEGFGWLWRHPFLRGLAIILGLMNMLGTLATTTLVLFAQEELQTSPAQFALLSIGSAIGGIVGGWTGSLISKRLGPGPSLWLALGGGGLTNLITGFTSSWIVVAVMFGLFMLLAVVWNVITVSLRQTIIPDHLLGRVNSVYRFFAWGMMPIGALLAGLMISVVEAIADRSLALRSPWIAAGVGQLLLLVVAGPKLTTARIEAARAGAAADPPAG
ncbi:MAG: MFS transporter [Actinomycetota bacterium]